MFEELIDVMETYGVTFDEPGLVLLQLTTNGVVAGSDGDFLGASNPAYIVSSEATVAKNMKAAIFLEEENGQKYKHINYYLENDFSKVTVNYSPTVEHAVHFLNT